MREFLENSKGAREFLQEKIYGNMATVYHRTKISDLINKVYTSGFKPGDGDMYGRGFYSTYELGSQLKNGMSEIYGPIKERRWIIQGFVYLQRLIKEGYIL